MVSFKPGDPAGVQELFDQIAPRYDQLNDLLSFGLHRLWKRQAIAWLQPRPGQQLIDLCCGTGDLALVLAARVRPGGSVLGIDAAAAPLATGLASASCDGAVIAYGLRNLADPGAGLRELRRLLRDGGRAAVLDFNRPSGLAARFQRLYLRRLVVPTAEQFGIPEHYAYLEDSLQRFPTGPQQEALARQAGFSAARHRLLAGGLMGLLELVA